MYRYTVVESPSDEIEDLDHYVFVVRARIGRCNGIDNVCSANAGTLDRDTKETTYYIDMKSEPLREILRTVLQRVNAIGLNEVENSVNCLLSVWESSINMFRLSNVCFTTTFRN